MRRDSGRLAPIIISLLGGALISGMGAWVAWGRTAVDEPKVIELIETRSPYLLDRKVLLKQIEQLEQVEDAVDELKLEVRELKTLLKALVRQENGRNR